MLRNRIYFILIKQKFKKYAKPEKTYPGADINSKHNPLVMALRMHRSIKTTKEAKLRKINIRKLNNPDVRTEVASELESKLVVTEIPHNIDIENTQNSIKNAITDIRDNNIGPPKYEANPEWMIEEILELMPVRQKHKRKSTRKLINY